MIDIALLGCGGSMPIPNRHLTSLLISFRGRKILVDCGEGTQVSMKLLGWGLKTIDLICLTHFHLDHVVGLPGLLSSIGNSGRTEPITIIGPSGLNHFFSGIRVMVPYLPYEINLIEDVSNRYPFKFGLQGLEFSESNPELIINTLHLMHSSLCLGYRFEIKRKPKFDQTKAMESKVPKVYWNTLQKGQRVQFENKIFTPDMVLGLERRGIGFSYLTDTRPIDEIIEFVSGSDLFICEGMYGDEHDLEKALLNKHLLFSEAATLANKAGVLELILTHFSPVMNEPEGYLDNARSIFPNTNLGYDRLTRTLKFPSENEKTSV